MKFLVDNQLPFALAKLLISRGHEADHVLRLGLGAASDTEIWKFATANTCVLVTKDEDFSRRASLPHAGVQVVWVRRGNCRTPALLRAFDSILPQLEKALEVGLPLIEVR